VRRCSRRFARRRAANPRPSGAAPRQECERLAKRSLGVAPRVGRESGLASPAIGCRWHSRWDPQFLSDDPTDSSTPSALAEGVIWPFAVEVGVGVAVLAVPGTSASALAEGRFRARGGQADLGGSGLRLLALRHGGGLGCRVALRLGGGVEEKLDSYGPAATGLLPPDELQLFESSKSSGDRRVALARSNAAAPRISTLTPLDGEANVQGEGCDPRPSDGVPVRVGREEQENVRLERPQIVLPRLPSRPSDESERLDLTLAADHLDRPGVSVVRRRPPAGSSSPPPGSSSLLPQSERRRVVRRGAPTARHSRCRGRRWAGGRRRETPVASRATAAHIRRSAFRCSAGVGEGQLAISPRATRSRCWACANLGATRRGARGARHPRAGPLPAVAPSVRLIALIQLASPPGWGPPHRVRACWE
jgi:hypothetical protein